MIREFTGRWHVKDGVVNVEVASFPKGERHNEWVAVGQHVLPDAVAAALRGFEVFQKIQAPLFMWTVERAVSDSLGGVKSRGYNLEVELPERMPIAKLSGEPIA